MSDTAIGYAHANHDRFLNELKDLLRIQSISTLPEHKPEMRQAATWLAEKLSNIGFDARLVPGDDYPVVYGEWLGAPGKPTLLVYGHYDVQPVDPIDEWKSAPFEPDIRNGNIYARGAADDKGQTMTLVLAAESWLHSTDSLPLNVKFLIEGQEESGGEAVERFVRENHALLRADAAEIADTGMYAPGIPALETGLRGSVYVEVHARGADHDLHSGLYGGVAPNPLNALGHIIAGLKDVEGKITIPGFYDDVVMPDEETRAMWQELPFDEREFLRDEVGSTALTGEPGFTQLERMWARPTLDVHGIPGGYTGQGAKTVIPAHASAKISLRIVPNQSGKRVFDALSERVKALTPPGIQTSVELLGCGDPVVVPSDSPWIRAARAALGETFGREAVLTRSGGSIPVVGLLKQELGVESVLMGWGLPDDNLHAPNEKLTLDNFFRGIDATIRFWRLAADTV